MATREEKLEEVEVYTRPEVTDFGTLEQLTAGCGPNTGSDAHTFLFNYTDSQGNFCQSN